MPSPTFSGHDVTRQFEAALCAYTGAKYAVTTTSCTMAILLAASWFSSHPGRRYRSVRFLTIPKRTYVGVPASLIHAGYSLNWSDERWEGEYQIDPLPLWDSARRFRQGMFKAGHMQCISMHWSKILGLSQGGAILHDDDRADAWLRKMRFDGRTEGVRACDDKITLLGYHAYLSPEVAAHGLMKLATLPSYNADLPKDIYPDCSKMRAFR